MTGAYSLESPALAWRIAARRAPIVAVIGTLCVHAALFALIAIAEVKQRHPVRPAEVTTQMVEIAAAEPTPSPAAAPAAAPAAPTVKRAPSARAARQAPAPASAQSAPLNDVQDEAVNFGDTFVVGDAASYGGGKSTSAGGAQQGSYDARASGSGLEGGTGKQPGGDAARAPSLAGAASWDCPFPLEADEAGIDHAVVGLRVDVAADGGVVQVGATADPGHGFAREARRCAHSKRWSPGLDSSGRPTRAVALVNVRFDR